VHRIITAKKKTGEIYEHLQVLNRAGKTVKTLTRRPEKKYQITCIAFHPTLPVIVIGAQSSVEVWDINTEVKLFVTFTPGQVNAIRL
jgi:hypothetical protein